MLLCPEAWPFRLHPMRTSSDNFLMVLQREFVQRCNKNSKYSLRAFARSLGVEASPLSAILRGKRPISSKMRTRLGLALGINLDELSKFEREHKPQNYQQIALDTYAVIADWYHYAILELTKVQDFKGTIDYISKTLNISKTEAHIAVERLKRVGLLSVNGRRWVDTSSDGLLSNINGDLSSHAARKLQAQILQRSLLALEELPTEVRSHTSMTMAIDPKDLPEAKKHIQEFRRKLCAFFESNKNPKEIYHLNVSLYPVTKPRDQK